MEKSVTRNLLKDKITKILFLLLLVRFGLYIPVPGIDLNIFSQEQTINPMFGFAKTLVGNSFLGVGSLGILPYINASIIIQILTPLFPNLERLQKEEGELGRQQISKYTRYLTCLWSIGLSTAIALFLIKPVTFDWNLSLCINVILSLTVGSILSMWFAELITEEGLGNGSSMIIFINIVGGITNNLSNLKSVLLNDNLLINNILAISQGLLIYLFIVIVVIVFQDSYKKIDIISAKRNINAPVKSFIPLKLNQGGVMPLVFSSTIAVLLVTPVQLFVTNNLFDNPETFPKPSQQL